MLFELFLRFWLWNVEMYEMWGLAPCLFVFVALAFALSLFDWLAKLVKAKRD